MPGMWQTIFYKKKHYTWAITNLKYSVLLLIKLMLYSNLKNDIRPAVFYFAVAEKLTLIEMSQETVSIENIFQQLTR